jgi:hypothetical protein
MEDAMSGTTRLHLSAILALTISAGLGFALAPPPAKAPANEPAPPKYRVSEPFTHENMTIFFLHGDDQIKMKGKKILTLDEALEQKKVIVHETKNVQQLAIENTSADEVFLQAGDIVKGGQQDRVIAFDMLLPAKSGKMPIASFCVERGRWSKRGGENAAEFSSSKNAIVGNDLKLAARGMKDQGSVWRGVGEAQKKLKDNLKAEVTGRASATSLQLTLEHKKLLEAVQVHIKKLQGNLDKQTDVIGYAVAINGKVNNADVYANADLFRKLWPKLLCCSAVEAVAEKKDKLKIEPVKPEAVTAFLAEAAKGKTTEKKLAGEAKEFTCTSAKCVLFVTEAKKGAVVRRSYVGK